MKSSAILVAAAAAPSSQPPRLVCAALRACPAPAPNSLGAAANRGATRARPLRHGGRGIKKRPAARATTDAAADAGWFNLCACRNDDVRQSPGRQPGLRRDSRRISAPARTTQRRSTRGSGARFSRRRGARARSAPAEASLVSRGAVGGVRVRADPRATADGVPSPARPGGHAAWARRSRASVRSSSFLAARRAGDPRRYSLHVRPGPRLDTPAGRLARWLRPCGLALAAGSLAVSLVTN